MELRWVSASPDTAPWTHCSSRMLHLSHKPHTGCFTHRELTQCFLCKWSVSYICTDIQLILKYWCLFNYTFRHLYLKTVSGIEMPQRKSHQLGDLQGLLHPISAPTTSDTAPTQVRTGLGKTDIFFFYFNTLLWYVIQIFVLSGYHLSFSSTGHDGIWEPVKIVLISSLFFFSLQFCTFQSRARVNYSYQ